MNDSLLIYVTAQFNFVWSILRWILFLLLPLMTISFHIYSNSECSHKPPSRLLKNT